MSERPSILERALDGPQKALLLIPWPSTAAIILKGSFGFLRQLLRSSRTLGLRARPETPPVR